MKRRQALLGIAGFSVLGSIAPHAFGQKGKPVVIGTLDGGERISWWAAFRSQLRALGYVEGESIVIESRFARGRLRDLPALAEELVRANPAVIVTASSAAVLAAKRATDTIPIVTATGSDHVSHGLANSLARPGGNVTGLSTLAADLTGKRLDLLREMRPKLSRLAVLWHRDNVGSTSAVRDLQAATRASRIALQNLGFRKAEELTEAFASAARERAEAVFVVLAPLTYAERKNIGALALKHRLPTMHGSSEFVDAGGLVSYGPSYADLHRRAAIYVDRILKGAKPGDLPIEEPTKFDLVLNLGTAKAIGVQIPQAVLVRASRVVD
jgi:putative ABC transport system substrate-binding protein